MGYLLGEWGLSVLVETDEANILFDTGKSISAVHNADSLGIDLHRVDKIVLSHGHYDHSGGLQLVLHRMRKEVEIIAHPGVWAAKYVRRQGQRDRYVGIPFQRELLESLGAAFNLTTEPVKITGNIMTTGEIPMVTDFEAIATTIYVKEDGGWQPDKILDDLALIINGEQGLIIILGCAHRGAINTLYHAQQLTGVEKIHSVLGGAHLIGTSEEQLLLTMKALRELDVQRLGLCHCTGLPALMRLAYEFGERSFFNVVGTTIDLP